MTNTLIYVPTEHKYSYKNDRFYQKLEELFESLSQNNKVTIVGDKNA